MAYGAAVGLYALSLLAKATGMTLPALLLLLDAWPLRRLPTEALGARSILPGWRLQPPPVAAEAATPVIYPHRHLSALARVALEKLPFLALAVPVAAVAIVGQWSAGAALSFGALSPAERLATMVVTSILYVWKLVVPTRLAVMYAVPAGGWPAAMVTASAVVIAGAIWGAYRVRGRMPYLAFGLAWFAVALSPVSGVVQAGFQSMADRYSYLPSIGITMAAVWAAADALRRVRSPRWTGAMVTAVAVALLTAACRVQVGYWRDFRTLFTHAADVTDNNAFACYQLGTAAFDEHDDPSAVDWYTRAQQADPNFTPAQDGLADCIARVNPPAAIPLYRAVIERAPTDPQAHAGLGACLLLTGDLPGADAAFRRALELDPGNDRARRGMAMLHENEPRTK